VSVTYYQSGKIKKLQTLPQLIRSETIKGIRRGQQKIKKSAAIGLSMRSIGRALFGKKLSGAYKNIKRELVKEGPVGLFSSGLKIDGVAAIQEKGLSIAPHVIRGKGKLQSRVGRRSAVRINGRGPLVSFARGAIVKAFMHPGVKAMPAFPFLDRAVSANRSSFRTEIDKGMARVAAVVNNG
jgi:hypothetical protein